MSGEKKYTATTEPARPRRITKRRGCMFRHFSLVACITRNQMLRFLRNAMKHPYLEPRFEVNMSEDQRETP